MGLSLRSPATRIGPLPAPTALTLEAGLMEDTMALKWNVVYGRDLYIAEYSTSPGSQWIQFYMGKPAQAICEGLTPGVEYWFRVRAQGTAGPSPWSDAVKKRA